MFIDFVFEISECPIERENRIKLDEIKRIMPEYPWWEYKKAILYELEDCDEARKEVFEELKKDLPTGCTLDVEKGILRCPKSKEYLSETINRIQALFSNPEEILALKRPFEWWRLEVDQLGGYLFFSQPYCNEFMSLHELMLVAMSDYYGDYNKEVVFYFGGIFHYFEP